MTYNKYNYDCKHNSNCCHGCSHDNCCCDNCCSHDSCCCDDCCRHDNCCCQDCCCNDCCNHTCCCVGPKGPKGDPGVPGKPGTPGAPGKPGTTATNQFLSLGATRATSPLPNVQTPITFSVRNAYNGGDISASVPTTTITLAPNHSYYVSYNVNSTIVDSMSAALSAGLILGSAPIDSTIASNDGKSFISVAGSTIITVGPGGATLKLATIAVSGKLYLLDAGISIIELK